MVTAMPIQKREVTLPVVTYEIYAEKQTCSNLWHCKQTAHARNEGQSFERLAHIHIIIRDTARVLSNTSQTVSQNPAWLNPHPQDVRSHLMQ